MKTSMFVKKLFNLSKAKQLYNVDYLSPDENDNECALCEIYLNNFVCEITDNFGRNHTQFKFTLTEPR